MKKEITMHVRNTLLRLLKEINYNNEEFDNYTIEEDTDIVEALQLDSLDIIELVMKCEDDFNIEIKDDEVEDLRKFGDICNYLCREYAGANFEPKPVDNRTDYEKAKDLGLTDLNRWEDGIDHHPRSLRLMEFLSRHDFNDYGDYFCWKKGGDGDNGETLMYQMDAFFEMLDKTGDSF